ncbi:MAG: tetratricopeptide repeat protein [Lewinellaceae bacterium]|nr:tetratricopeptide repeat protein [Lewinella sp.]MCB9280999.1 tetratricopeptide repeat protein [Lewinellaceae bacterium]
MTTMHKAIFCGRLEFGNERTFEQAQKMFDHWRENHYRGLILFKGEDVFSSEQMSLDIPRLIAQSNDRQWLNTVNLLRQVSEYAIAGDVSAWLSETGHILKYAVIEPEGDKTATQSYLQGRKLVSVEGKEAEAQAALSRAIEKFERHALAYERRGYVNYRLRNYKDALYDYTKSININNSLPNPYYGRALVCIAQNDFESAVVDLDYTIEKAIALQPIYWTARRLKAECLINMGKLADAAKELRLFTSRKFLKEDPNFAWRRKATYQYAKCLIAIGQKDDALKALQQAAALPQGEGKISNEDIQELIDQLPLGKKAAAVA